MVVAVAVAVVVATKLPSEEMEACGEEVAALVVCIWAMVVAVVDLAVRYLCKQEMFKW